MDSFVGCHRIQFSRSPPNGLQCSTQTVLLYELFCNFLFDLRSSTLQREIRLRNTVTLFGSSGALVLRSSGASFRLARCLSIVKDHCSPSLAATVIDASSEYIAQEIWLCRFFYLNVSTKKILAIDSPTLFLVNREHRTVPPEHHLPKYRPPYR